MLRTHRCAGGVGALATTAFLAISLYASGASAGPPKSPLVFPFGGDERIYVLEGAEDCALFEEGDFTAERCFELALLVDARGRYQGTGSITFDGAIFSGDLTGAAKGRQRRKGNRTEVSLRVRLRGFVEIDLGGPPIQLPARIDLRCDGEISAGGALDVPCALQLRIPGARPTRTEIPLAATVAGGDWTLAINSLLDLGNGRLEGGATDSFGFSYQVRGKYDDRRDRSKLMLKGLRGSLSKGAKIRLKKLLTPAPEVAVGRGKYKLLGAKGSGPVSTEAED